eukprot:CFRG5630T1
MTANLQAVVSKMTALCLLPPSINTCAELHEHIRSGETMRVVLNSVFSGAVLKDRRPIISPGPIDDLVDGKRKESLVTLNAIVTFCNGHPSLAHYFSLKTFDCERFYDHGQGMGSVIEVLNWLLQQTNPEDDHTDYDDGSIRSSCGSDMISISGGGEGTDTQTNKEVQPSANKQAESVSTVDRRIGVGSEDTDQGMDGCVGFSTDTLEGMIHSFKASSTWDKAAVEHNELRMSDCTVSTDCPREVESKREEDEYTSPFKAVAIYPYAATRTDELSFSEGDVIEVLSCGDEGWWEGRLGMYFGWFPSPYVTKYVNSMTEDMNEGKDLAGQTPSHVSSFTDATSKVQNQPAHTCTDTQKTLLGFRTMVGLDLINSEYEFTTNLESFLNHFAQPLKDIESVPDRAKRAILAPLFHIVHFHNTLYASIYAECESEDPYYGIVFAKLIPELKKAYMEFSAAHPIAIEALRCYGETVGFTSLLNELAMTTPVRPAIESKKHTTKPNGIALITSTLFLPLMRLQKFARLFEDMVRYTPDLHSHARTNMLVMDELNSLCNNSERVRKLCEIERKILLSGIVGLEKKDIKTLGKLEYSVYCVSQCKSSVVPEPTGVLRIGTTISQAENIKEWQERILLVFKCEVVVLARVYDSLNSTMESYTYSSSSMSTHPRFGNGSGMGAGGVGISANGKSTKPRYELLYRFDLQDTHVNFVGGSESTNDRFLGNRASEDSVMSNELCVSSLTMPKSVILSTNSSKECHEAVDAIQLAIDMHLSRGGILPVPTRSSTPEFTNLNVSNVKSLPSAKASLNTKHLPLTSQTTSNSQTTIQTQTFKGKNPPKTKKGTRFGLGSWGKDKDRSSGNGSKHNLVSSEPVCADAGASVREELDTGAKHRREPSLMDFNFPFDIESGRKRISGGSVSSGLGMDKSSSGKSKRVSQEQFSQLWDTVEGLKAVIENMQKEMDGLRSHVVEEIKLRTMLEAKLKQNGVLTSDI